MAGKYVPGASKAAQELPALEVRQATKSARKARPPARKKIEVNISARMKALLDGELDVEDLDDEELIKGQLRADDGTFRGQPSLLIPRTMHQRIIRELVMRGDGKLKQYFNRALETHNEVMMNPRANPQARLEAARYIWERVAGKIPNEHVVTATVKKWEQMADEVLVDLEENEE